MNMDDQTLSKIKKQDKKYLWKYVLLMVVCLVLGGIGGYLGARFLDGRVDDLYNLSGSFYLSIVPFVRYGMIVFSIILLIVQIFHYQKCKKELSHLCLDDEESVEKFDKLLSYGLYINNFGLLGIILLGGIAFYMIPKTFSSITLILSLILYFVVFISVIFFK